MRVSAEVALHLCVLLAAVPGNGVAVADLADFHELPPAATAKLLQQLAAAGIVASRTGRGGGYGLARPAGEITVAEVVAAAGGVAPAFRCTEIRRRGPCIGETSRYSLRCAIASAMDAAETAWWAALDRETLADLARSMDASVDDGIRSRAGQWLREKARRL